MCRLRVLRRGSLVLLFAAALRKAVLTGPVFLFGEGRPHQPAARLRGSQGVQSSVDRGDRVRRRVSDASLSVLGTLEKMNAQYTLDAVGSRANPAMWGRKVSRPEDLIFNQELVWDFIWTQPLRVAMRAAYLASVALGIRQAWTSAKAGEAAANQRPVGSAFRADSLRARTATTPWGDALRVGLAEMGVFFVKIGQTCAQRPDLVGDEVAEELKGLQEKNTPFPDDVALRIIAEDLQHQGPLAPGVPVQGCDPDQPPLLAKVDPRHVASASLGQVYRGRLHDGREVALKVQRPGVRENIGVDWAIAVLTCKAYRALSKGFNDYSLIVDTVAKGIQQELDYHNEAANLDEFALRHAFLPFVSSPGWIPEYTGPEGSARVLCMDWYPSRAPSELAPAERRALVEMAVEACVVQLLVTGFVHADPHEGNLRFGDDGRVVFLDFGLMDRVDFGIMEGFAAGIRHVLNQNWLELVRVMQEVRFTPRPMVRLVREGDGMRQVECSLEEFSEVLGKQMASEAAATSRFGAMATTLRKLSDRYLMLTPPYVALLCRTFITLEGLLGDDPLHAESFNIYEVALPFAISRLLSPRTRKGQVALREVLIREKEVRVLPRGGVASSPGQVNWAALMRLLEETSAPHEDDDEDGEGYGAQMGVQRRLLRTSEGAALRRVLYDIDLFETLRTLLVSAETRPLREKLISTLASHLVKRRHKRKGGRATKKRPWGARSKAAGRFWGHWREKDPYALPQAAVKTSKRAWKVVMRRQVQRFCSPRWRLPFRSTLGLLQVAAASAAVAARVLLRAARPGGSRVKAAEPAHLAEEAAPAGQEAAAAALGGGAGGALQGL